MIPILRGLIRQSEFRTVEGAQARETHTFSTRLQGMVGFDYHEDDIHRDNLDHYLNSSSSYGPFLESSVEQYHHSRRNALSCASRRSWPAPALLRRTAARHHRIEKQRRSQPGRLVQSLEHIRSPPRPRWHGRPGDGPARWLPSASFSLGQAFFTEDPRIAVASSTAGNPDAAASFISPFERSHSEQLVLEKQIAATDVRVTVGRTTSTQTLGKIDPDNGTEQPLGPGTLKFLTASVRHQFPFGTVQTVVSKADARLLGATVGGVMIPANVHPKPHAQSSIAC